MIKDDIIAILNDIEYEKLLGKLLRSIQYYIRMYNYTPNRKNYMDKNSCSGCVFVQSTRIGRFDTLNDFTHECAKTCKSLNVYNYDGNVYDKFLRRLPECIVNDLKRTVADLLDKE